MFDIGVDRTRDKAVILLGAFSKTSTEFRYIPASDANAPWNVISPRQADHEYDVDHRGDLFYIRTNKGAKNFRVVTAPVSDTSEKNWKEFIAHRPAVKIESIDLFSDHAASEWENGLSRLRLQFQTTRGTASSFLNRFTRPAFGQSRIQDEHRATTINR
jgi:oligopeptidase B